MAEPEIYFHVGLGKVASTYLQHKIFPRLSGIHYISTHSYKKCKSIIPGLKAEKILVSREFDRQFEEEVRWFTRDFPHARIIILLRRHDDWIASQYKRHVKNGFLGSFTEFLDVKNDQGYWSREELNFSRKLQVIAECCENPPLVLFYDELIQDPKQFLKKMTDYMGVTELGDFPQEKVHTSFSEKQLRFLRGMNRRLLKQMPVNYQNKWKHWLLYRPYWLMFHLALYSSKYFPQSWIPKVPLISNEEMQAVQQFTKQDWELLKSEYK